MSTYCEIALRSMSQNTFDDKWALVQAMAWFHQAISHYMSQCWPRSKSPYGVTITRPQWDVSQHFSDIRQASWRLKPSAPRLYVQQLAQINITESITFWPFVKDIHRSIMWKVFSCHILPITMISSQCLSLISSAVSKYTLSALLTNYKSLWIIFQFAPNSTLTKWF